MAEYQVAVDFWKYQEKSKMSDSMVEALYNDAVQKGIIEENLAGEELDLVDKKNLLLKEMDGDLLHQLIQNKIDELQAEKDTLQGQLDANADEADGVIGINAVTGTEISRQNATLAGNQRMVVKQM